MTPKAFAPALIAALLTGSFGGVANAIPPLVPIIPHLVPLVPLVPLPILCPDLSVSISVAPGNQPQTLRFTVRITNVSPVNFSSGVGQQRLSVHRVGGFGGGETLNYDFQQIAHGASRSWSFDRSMQEGPYAYDAALWISPNVYSDSNTHNNECHANNNAAHTQT